MVRHVVRALERAALLSGEDHEEDGAFGLDRVGGEGVGQFDDADGAGAVVVGAMPDLEVTLAVGVFDFGRSVVVVMGA